jgi:WD40 repeat protein
MNIQPNAETQGSQLWDITNRSRPRRIAAAFPKTNNGVELAFAGENGVLSWNRAGRQAELWDITSGTHRPLGRITFPNAPNGEDLISSPDLRWVAALNSGDNRIQDAFLLDLRDLKAPRKVTIPNQNKGIPLAIGVGGRLLAATKTNPETDNASKSILRLWDISDRAKPRYTDVDTGHRGQVRNASFSPDGRILATVGDENAIKLWNIEDPRKPRELGKLTGAYMTPGFSFSPDGRMLASPGSDNAAWLWNIRDPAHPQHTTTLSQPDPVADVAFNADGRTLATSGYGETVRLWDVSPIESTDADLIREACEVAHGGLTREEWQKFVPGMPFRQICT